MEGGHRPQGAWPALAVLGRGVQSPLPMSVPWRITPSSQIATSLHQDAGGTAPQTPLAAPEPALGVLGAPPHQQPWGGGQAGLHGPPSLQGGCLTPAALCPRPGAEPWHMVVLGGQCCPMSLPGRGGGGSAAPPPDTAAVPSPCSVSAFRCTPCLRHEYLIPDKRERPPGVSAEPHGVGGAGVPTRGEHRPGWAGSGGSGDPTLKHLSRGGRARPGTHQCVGGTGLPVTLGGLQGVHLCSRHFAPAAQRVF